MSRLMFTVLIDGPKLVETQVIYGYQLTGENFPPFGCLESEDTTEAIDIKFGFLNLIWYDRVLTSSHQGHVDC